jgi:hypothetical protein
MIRFLESGQPRAVSSQGRVAIESDGNLEIRPATDVSGRTSFRPLG